MPTDPRRVLVAGATGRLGAVTHALLARGHAVRAMTRDVVALAVLAIERPSDFAGERIPVASDALNAEQAADALQPAAPPGRISFPVLTRSQRPR
jgi:nucleoside-diphosphate-sugar epimerase